MTDILNKMRGNMPNENKKTLLTTARSLLLFLSSVVFVSLVFLTTETGLSRAFTVNIPLHNQFPIPVFFWLGVFLYLIAVSVLLKFGLKKLVPSGLLLGFFAHFIFSLLNMSLRNARGEISWSSNLYLLYFEALFTFIMCLLSVASGILLKISSTERIKDNYPHLIYPVPLIFVYSAGLVFIQRNYALSVIMCALFFISFFLRSSDNVYNAIKKRLECFSRLILNENVFLLLIFFAAIFFRIVFLKRVMTNPDYIHTASDGGFMDRNAMNFLSNKFVGIPFSKGYWVFLAGLYAVFGRNYFIVCVIQSLFGSLAILMAYTIAKKAFSVAVARITAIVAVLDYSLIFSAAGLGHQAMDIFYSMLIVYLLIKYNEMGINKKSTLLLLFTGFICGLAIANRDVNVFVPVVASIWLIPKFLAHGYNKFKTAAVISLFLLFSALGEAPFLYLNYLETGSPYTQSSTYGVKNFLENHNPYLTKIGFDPLNDFSGSMKVVTDKPLVFLKAAWLNYYTKFMDLYFNQDYGCFDPIFLLRKPQTDYFLVMWFYAYSFTIAGLALIFFIKRKYNKTLVNLFLMIIAYKTLFHLATIGIYRYRPAMELFLIMFAAFALCEVVKLAKE